MRAVDKRLRQEWEALLKAEGLTVRAGEPPAWHVSPKDRGRIFVRFPGDWAEGNRNHASGDRRQAVATRRETAEYYHTVMSDYVWEVCDWAAYPDSHRPILEAHVIHGETPLEIAGRLGVKLSLAAYVLRKHRRLAGVPARR